MNKITILIKEKILRTGIRVSYVICHMIVVLNLYLKCWYFHHRLFLHLFLFIKILFILTTEGFGSLLNSALEGSTSIVDPHPGPKSLPELSHPSYLLLLKALSPSVGPGVHKAFLFVVWPQANFPNQPSKVYGQRKF